MNPSLLLRPTLLLALAACSEAVTTAGPRQADEDDLPEDLEPGVDDDTGAVVDVTWGIAGELALVEGAVDVEASALRLETRGVACDVRAAIAAAPPVEPLPDGLLHAWTFDTVPDPDAACRWRGPTAFTVAVGPTDASLRSAADRAGLDADTAYGLFVGASGALDLVGLTGPENVLEGDTPPATTPPVPDGEYRLVTLYGIPWVR